MPKTTYTITAIGDKHTIGSLTYTGDKWVDDNYGYDHSGDATSLEEAIEIINMEKESFIIRDGNDHYMPETTFLVTHFDQDKEEYVEDYRLELPFKDFNND